MAGSDLKSMHPGKAAMDGVLAAALVEHQLTASAKALEGDFGYLAVMSADPAPEKISTGLGETWNLTSNGYKLYPSGSLTHPMIDGVIALVTDEDVAPGDVTVIDIRVSRARGALHRPAPADHAACRPSSACGTARLRRRFPPGRHRGTGAGTS